jgi:hypothetical protein
VAQFVKVLLNREFMAVFIAANQQTLSGPQYKHYTLLLGIYFRFPSRYNAILPERDFRLPSRFGRDLRSSDALCGAQCQILTDVSGQHIGPIFKVQEIEVSLTLQDS